MPNLSKNVYRINNNPPQDREYIVKEAGADLFFRGLGEYKERHVPLEFLKHCIKVPITKKKKKR